MNCIRYFSCFLSKPKVPPHSVAIVYDESIYDVTHINDLPRIIDRNTLYHHNEAEEEEEEEEEAPKITTYDSPHYGENNKQQRRITLEIMDVIKKRIKEMNQADDDEVVEFHSTRIEANNTIIENPRETQNDAIIEPSLKEETIIGPYPNRTSQPLSTTITRSVSTPIPTMSS